MTSGSSPQPERSLDHCALGYVQRRMWVFGSWWYGIMLATSGAAYALAAALMGQEPETGVIMAMLGLGLAGLGWAVSAPQRFTRKPPRPSKEIARAEQSIRINPGVVVLSNLVMLVILLVLAFTMPRDAAPEGVPILAAMGVWAPMFGVLIMRAQRLLIERKVRYARWRDANPPLP